MLTKITPVILTYNEAPNIQRTLEALTWANRIVVLDSFSDDETEEICRKYSNVDFFQRRFDSLAKQWEAAIDKNIDTEWVLALDADYVLSPELIQELEEVDETKHIDGYRTHFIYVVDGKPLRGSLYPPVTTLYRVRKASYIQDGHAQRVVISGMIGNLNQKIFHDDRKSSERWHHSQVNYARQEAEKLSKLSLSEMKLNDKFRFFGLGPVLVIPYTLIYRGVILDGVAGMKYTYQRVVAELYLLRARLGVL